MSAKQLQKLYKARRRELTLGELDECLKSTSAKHGTTPAVVGKEIEEYLNTNNYVGVVPSAWSSHDSGTSRAAFLKAFTDDSRQLSPLNARLRIRRVTDDGSEDLRVCTFNVHFWMSPDGRVFNYDGMMNVIKSTHADVVCLQEAVLPNELDAGNSATSRRDGYTIDDIVGDFEKMGYMFNTSCVTDNKNHNAPNSFFGNVIFSKHKIVGAQAGILDANYQNRCFVAGSIKDVMIACVHLDVFDDTEKTRVEQVKAMLAKLADHGTLIVCGDFNALREDDYTSDERDWLSKNNQGVPLHFEATDLMIKNGFRDAFQGGQMKHSVWTARRVDYEWHRGDVTVANAYVYYTDVSDHYPLVVDYAIGFEPRSPSPPRSPPVKSPKSKPSGFEARIDKVQDMKGVFERLMWTHNTPYETLHKMITGEYDREIRCCWPSGEPYKRGAQFRYGLDSQYGDVVFVAKATDWWKKVKGVQPSVWGGPSLLVDHPVFGHFWTDDFEQYEGKNIKKMDESLRGDAQMFTFRPRDVSGNGGECSKGSTWDFAWCNIQLHSGTTVELDLIDTVMVPRWMVEDKAASAKMPDSATMVKLVTNKLPNFPDGTKNPLNGKFVLYGPAKATDHYQYVRSAYQDETFNATYMSFLNPANYATYGSTARNPFPSGNSSRMAMSADAYEDGEKIYMRMLLANDCEKK